MDPDLIMAIDIVDVLRLLGSTGGPLDKILTHAAQHIEDLRKKAYIAELKLAPPPAPPDLREPPITRSYDPNGYKDVGE